MLPFNFRSQGYFIAKGRHFLGIVIRNEKIVDIGIIHLVRTCAYQDDAGKI